MKRRLRWMICLTMSVLMLFATGCATTIEIPLGDDIQAIEESEPAPAKGAFLTVEGTKKVAKTYKEMKALKRELEKQPGEWSRFWTSSALFITGAGVGVWLIP